MKSFEGKLINVNQFNFQDFGAFRSQQPWGRSQKELRAVVVEQALSLSCNSTQRQAVLHRLRVTLLSL